MDSTRLLALAQRLQAIAQAGIAFHGTPYDLERYQEVLGIGARLLAEVSDEPLEKIIHAFASQAGYPTPKVDVRAVVFRADDEVLLVRERSDGGRWTLPGGWADVGYSPFEVAVKETREETGLVVRAVRLIALFDKRKHPHPPYPWHTYKAFVLCEVEGGELAQSTLETTGARWVRREDLESLELSTDRVTRSQVEGVFPFARDPRLPVLCD